MASTAAEAGDTTTGHKEMVVSLDATGGSRAVMPPQSGSMRLAAAVAAIAAATLCGAWVFQYGFDIRPCPLCLEQRYAYYLAIPLGAVLAMAAWRGAPRGLLALGFVLLAAAALANAVLGGYHAGVEWGFWPGPTECTGSVLDLGKPGSLFDNLDKVKVVRCDEVQWRFLGLSLAGYNVLISLLMALLALIGLRRIARR